MKHLILCISVAIILLNTITANAAPLKLPSRHQIVKLIKQVDDGDLSIVGLSNWKDCDKVSIRSVKILRVGRASSNYYKESGNYIGSGFMVKVKATGTCTFDFRHDFYKDIDNDGRKDSIEGTLPIINEPLEVGMSTDRYGDWVAGSLNLVNSRKVLESSRVKRHVKEVFIRGKAAMGDKYTSRVIINNIQKGQGKGTYYNGFVVSEKKFTEGVTKGHVQRIFGKSYRPADWEDLVNYAKNNGDVLALLKRLGIPSQDGVYITSHGWSLGKYAAVHCSKFNSKKYFGLKKKLNNQPLCMSLHYRRAKAKILAVDKSIFGSGTRGSYKTPRPTLSLSSKQSSHASSKPSSRIGSVDQLSMTDNKRVNEVILLFKKRPKAFKVFQQQSEGVRYRLFKRIYERNTKAERRRAFLNVANSLENSGKQRSSSGSLRHSHGGRFHSHKFPRQGKAHRHGNGAVGR